MSKALTLVWFRYDLRLGDNPALMAAVESGGPVVPVFIWSCGEEEPWAPGAATRWWLHHSLEALRSSLAKLGSRVVIRKGESLGALRAVASETGARRVAWNRQVEPSIAKRDARIENALRADGLEVTTFNASLLFEPSALRTKTGGPYQVFTPFWRSCLAAPAPPEPLPAPSMLAAPASWPRSVALGSLELLPKRAWAVGLQEAWSPGEDGANALLDSWLHSPVHGYAEGRDRADQDEGSSRLSPHLHFGEISPRRLWHAARLVEKDGVAGSWLRQVVWREFAHHLLVHFPTTPELPLREEFARFPWEPDPGALRAWQRGLTGYPIVDAAMRQLWQTGWMHNRARMIVASFLVKDLLVSWTEGARWFWDTLVDADLANNTMGWQWVAGCGADAAPYFRIFNPVTQATKLDPKGDYVRRFVPELARLPAPLIHEPWKAPPLALIQAGVELGVNYPRAIVDHALARDRALAALARMKSR